jgi:tetratricopeptide (TPR) repeat protein
MRSTKFLPVFDQDETNTEKESMYHRRGQHFVTWYGHLIDDSVPEILSPSMSRTPLAHPTAPATRKRHLAHDGSNTTHVQHGDDYGKVEHNEILLKENGLHSDLGHDGTEQHVHVENSDLFRILFAATLGLIFLFRVIMCGFLLRYRKDGSLQLAQPLVLAALIVAGSISIVSCIFLTHKDRNETHEVNEVFCRIRQIFILLPLTFAGNILLARVWRVVILLTPVLVAGTRISLQESDDGLSCGEKCKCSLVFHLTNVADFYYWVEWLFRNSKTKTPKKMQRTSTALRKKVPLTQLFVLTLILTFPQLVLQVLVLSVPAMQAHFVAKDLIIAGEMIGEANECAAEAGLWPLCVGIALTIIPYILASIIALNSSDELPKVFNESKAYTRCCKVVVLTVAITVPPLIFDGGPIPDVTVYLFSCLVFSLAMSPCWFLAYPKIWQAVTTFDENRQTQSTLRKLLRKHKSAKGFLPMSSRDDNGKSAKLALTIGKMYEEMGMAQKSIDLFDEALAVWECDPGREHKEKIGGFTLEEINSFTVQDLEHIVNLLIARGRVKGTFQVNEATEQKNAAQSWLDALEIYEKAPARANMKDRSMLFPVFSGLFVFLKGGKIQQDAKCNFEQNLARKFVRETKLQGDPVHYTRALAMFCEVKARLGKYRTALESFATLKEIYDPEEHSEGVVSAYGTDRSAQAFSQAALWHLQNGEEGKVLDACEYVLDNLMPLMDPKNVLNSCEMLLPIIYVYKSRGQENRMRNLFQKYVISSHNRYFKEHSSPCSPVFKPLMMLLSICHDPVGFSHLAEAVTWLLVEENGVASEFLDSIYTKLCWSPHSLVAELCLRLAKRLIDTNGDISDAQMLILKGLRLAKQADKKMKNNLGNVILPISYALHEPVYKELREIAVEMGISSNDDFESLHSFSGENSVSSSVADTKNVPSSYLKKGGSSQESMSSTSCFSSDVVLPNETTLSQFESGTLSNSSVASGGGGSDSRNSRLSSFVEEDETTVPGKEATMSLKYVTNTDKETMQLNVHKKDQRLMQGAADFEIHRVTFSTGEN